MKDKNLALMDEIMQTVTQTDEWIEIQMNDPQIVSANMRLSVAMERAKAALPKELYIELADAQAAEVAAVGDAAILYGIHVADAIRDVASRPCDLSEYVLKRVTEQQ